MRSIVTAALILTAAQAVAQAPDSTAQADSTLAAEIAEARDLDLRAQRATLFSIFVPGSGHLYAGETGRGLVLLGVGLSPIAASLATGVTSFNCDSRRGCDELDGATVVFLTAALAGTAAWVYGVVDANNAVRRVAASRVDVAPTVMAGPSGSAPGLALRLSL